MSSRPRVLIGLVVAALVLALVGVYRGSHSLDGAGGWDAKDAWRRCRQADPGWPDAPAQRCRALHMCVHEAAPGDNTELLAAIAATPDCPAP